VVAGALLLVLLAALRGRRYGVAVGRGLGGRILIVVVLGFRVGVLIVVFLVVVP
jgi:hypothetical protein